LNSVLGKRYFLRSLAVDFVRNILMRPYHQERTELLEELGKVQRRIRRHPHLTSDAQAILFRLRELRQLARSAQKVAASAGDPDHPA
jgi:hypothetical protein